MGFDRNAILLGFMPPEVIWPVTTPQAQEATLQWAGLEAGLTIDALADEPGNLIDRADAASLPGDADETADALAALGERSKPSTDICPGT